MTVQPSLQIIIFQPRANGTAGIWIWNKIHMSGSVRQKDSRNKDQRKTDKQRRK